MTTQQGYNFHKEFF